MIQEVIITDFQSHKKTKLEFVPGFNIVTGHSGSGKSAFLRALNSVLYNNVSGTSFVRIGKESPSYYTVGITLDNGISVKRHKGKEVNSYVVSVLGEKDKVFSSVKTDVPQEVSRATGIREVNIDASTTVNIQFCSQFDGPFILAESGPAKMKFLNTLSGTSAVDCALKASNSESTKSTKDMDTAKKDFEIAEGLEKEIDDKVSTLHTANEYLTEKYEELKKLLSTRETFESLQKITTKLKGDFDALNKLTELFDRIDIDLLSSKISKLVSLLRLKDEYSELSKKYAVLIKEEKSLSSIDVDAVSENIKKLKLTKDLFSMYNDLKAKIKENKESTAKIWVEMSTAVSKYVAGLEELKVCPVCKSSITGDVLDHINEML